MLSLAQLLEHLYVHHRVADRTVDSKIKKLRRLFEDTAVGSGPIRSEDEG